MGDYAWTRLRAGGLIADVSTFDAIVENMMDEEGIWPDGGSLNNNHAATDELLAAADEKRPAWLMAASSNYGGAHGLPDVLAMAGMSYWLHADLTEGGIIRTYDHRTGEGESFDAIDERPALSIGQLRDAAEHGRDLASVIEGLAAGEAEPPPLEIAPEVRAAIETEKRPRPRKV